MEGTIPACPLSYKIFSPVKKKGVGQKWHKLTDSNEKEENTDYADVESIVLNLLIRSDKCMTLRPSILNNLSSSVYYSIGV